MKPRVFTVVALAFYSLLSAQAPRLVLQPEKLFLEDFDLNGAASAADELLRSDRGNARALFIQMEVSELQDDTATLLDSALRLCNLNVPSEVAELAGNRVLQHAENSSPFNAVLKQIKTIAAGRGPCAANLRLALVASAADGNPQLSIDQTAIAAGLLRRWKVAGPFGHFSNVDFDRRWAAEQDMLASSGYLSIALLHTLNAQRGEVESSHFLKTENFFFPDGMLSLPDYFPTTGVFYAASDVQIRAGASRLDVLSSGTYEVFIDGKPKLIHDARYSVMPDRNARSLTLSPGRHRVLLKFTPDALPISASLQKTLVSIAKPPSWPRALEEYAHGLNLCFRGDFVGLAKVLAPNQTDRPLQYYLHALLYSAAEEHSARARSAWQQLASSRPSTVLPEVKMAEGDLERGKALSPEVVARLLAHSGSQAALEVLSRVPIADLPDATGVYLSLLQLHTSCANLSRAEKAFTALGAFGDATSAEKRLSACATGDLAYAKLLAEAGRHTEAATYLKQVVAGQPLDRKARRMLVEQLVLANQAKAAQQEAGALHHIAPNSSDAERLAADPTSVLDGRQHQVESMIGGPEFYRPYRGDSLAIARRSMSQELSGGSSVVLLSDHVVNVTKDGPVSIYVHRMVRPLNKDGVVRFGEVVLPRGVEVLELRTIKSDGQVVEPELTAQKSSISMPALVPGDVIDEEYVAHFDDLEQAPEDLSNITLGSQEAPVLDERVVVVLPQRAGYQVHSSRSLPNANVRQEHGSTIWTWQRSNVPQVATEPYSPAGDVLPEVTIARSYIVRDRLRDAYIDSTRTGLHSAEATLSFRKPQASGELGTARELYKYLNKVESTGPDWMSTSAEDSLTNSQGSRTAVLLSLARTMGLHADLVLARRLDQPCEKRVPDCYSEPLVRFHFTEAGVVDVDAEQSDGPFGALPSNIGRDTLLVPLTAADEKLPSFITLSANRAEEKSIAEADLTIERNDLVVVLKVRLSTDRGREVRNLVRRANEREKQAFFEQLAIRTFPGATAVLGSVENESDNERPLALTLHCRVPKFIGRSGAVDIDQILPALGLNAMFAKQPNRRYPLYIGSLYSEAAVFRLHLPSGSQVRALPAAVAEKTEFGEFALRATQVGQVVELRREFRVPVQVIIPEKYPAFVAFARRVDEAERQRMTLDIGKMALSAQSSGAP